MKLIYYPSLSQPVGEFATHCGPVVMTMPRTTLYTIAHTIAAFRIPLKVGRARPVANGLDRWVGGIGG